MRLMMLMGRMLLYGLLLLVPATSQAAWWCTDVIFEDLTSWGVCMTTKKECLQLMKKTGTRISCQKTTDVYLLDYVSRSHGRARRAFDRLSDCSDARMMILSMEDTISIGMCH
jgi:hypothetical protein